VRNYKPSSKVVKGRRSRYLDTTRQSKSRRSNVK